jgi:hypothetical protein
VPCGPTIEAAGRHGLRVNEGEQMSSRLRQEWQAFKKAHPDFEKSKNFNSDVGPQFDQFDKARTEFDALRSAAEQKLSAKAKEVVKLGMSLDAALKGYEAVVKELEATDRTIRADFRNQHLRDIQRYLREAVHS